MTGHDMCQSFNTLVNVTDPGETIASTELLRYCIYRLGEDNINNGQNYVQPRRYGERNEDEGFELLEDSELTIQPDIRNVCKEKDFCCLNCSKGVCMDQRWHGEDRKSI